MNKALIVSSYQSVGVSVLTGLALCLQAPLAIAQNLTDDQTTKSVVVEGQTKPLPPKQSAKASNDSYILGPGDGLEIELLDLPELSGYFPIGPDGTMYLPRLRALYVEGLTVEELRSLLTKEFRTYVKDPQVYVRPIAYRPIRVYVGGEVKRPGYYTFSGETDLLRLSKSLDNQQIRAATSSDVVRPAGVEPGVIRPGRGVRTSGASSSYGGSAVFPTVFDAIRTAQGITPYSDLTQVQVTRKLAKGLGGGRIRTNLNFLSLITEGNESQNIRLFDSDVVNVSKSNVVMHEQLLKAGQSNLSPEFIDVFVTGRVNTPGGVTVPQGSSLNQAIAVAGGTQLLKGKVEFVRFTRGGQIDRRLFKYNPEAAANSSNNPLLSAGDLIRVRDSPLSATTSLLNEITGPALSIYSIYNLYEGLTQ